MDQTITFQSDKIVRHITTEDTSLIRTDWITEIMNEVTTDIANKVKDDTSHMELPLSIHIIFLALLLPLGVGGNAFLIYAYAKRSNKLQAGLVFTVAMALLDIFACLVVMPLVPLLPYFTRIAETKNIETGKDFFFRSTFVTITLNLVLLVGMALDRVWAVFRPFSYSTSKKRSLQIIAALMIFSLGYVYVFRLIPSEKGFSSRIGATTLVLLSFATLFSSYAAIAVKLNGQRKKVRNIAGSYSAFQKSSSTKQNPGLIIQTKSTESAEVVSTATDARTDGSELKRVQFPKSTNASETAKKETNITIVKSSISEADKRVIKIFISLTALFFISFIPLLVKLTNLVETMGMFYVYLTNHSANPIIYYLIDNNFHAETNRLFRKMKFW